MRYTAIESAETVAFLRALAVTDASLATPCSDTHARHFLGSKNRGLLDWLPHSVLKALVGRIAPGSYDFTIARTRHFDEALLAGLRRGIDQVVILGAGYDSRALRFERELAGIQVFELDHPGTQARKIELLNKAADPLPRNLKLIAIDFARQSFADVLAANGFRADRKTLFLWEGVSYYLPEAAISDVLTFVSRCARGSSIIFDYATATFVAGDTGTHGGRQVARWLKKIGEPFLFGLDPAKSAAFLAHCGLQVLSHLGPADLERLYLARVGGGSCGKALGHVCIIEGASI
jgi:methyltransferase (TIGR00027 family)